MGFATAPAFLLIEFLARRRLFFATSSPSFQGGLRQFEILRGLLHGLVQLLIVSGVSISASSWPAVRTPKLLTGQPYVVGDLITGQNPASSEAAAKAVLEQLKAHAGAH